MAQNSFVNPLDIVDFIWNHRMLGEIAKALDTRELNSFLFLLSETRVCWTVWPDSGLIKLVCSFVRPSSDFDRSIFTLRGVWSSISKHGRCDSTSRSEVSNNYCKTSQSIEKVAKLTRIKAIVNIKLNSIQFKRSFYRPSLSNLLQELGQQMLKFWPSRRNKMKKEKPVEHPSRRRQEQNHPLLAWLDGSEVSASGWGSGGPRFQSHPRLTFQSCSRYQLNQLGSEAASESTFNKSNTCGVSNNRLYFTVFTIRMTFWSLQVICSSVLVPCIGENPVIITSNPDRYNHKISTNS